MTTEVKKIVVTRGRFTAEIDDSFVTVTTPDGPQSYPSQILSIPTEDAQELVDLIVEGRETLARIRS